MHLVSCIKSSQKLWVPSHPIYINHPIVNAFCQCLVNTAQGDRFLLSVLSQTGWAVVFICQMGLTSLSLSCVKRQWKVWNEIRDKIHETSKSYKLCRGIITGSKIVGTHPLPRTTQQPEAQQGIYCTVLGTTHPPWSYYSFWPPRD